MLSSPLPSPGLPHADWRVSVRACAETGPAAAYVLALLVLAVSASACSSDLTQLIVVVDGDLSVPAVVDEVRLEVSGPSGEVRTERQSLTSASQFPLTLGVVAEADVAHRDRLGPVNVVAIGTLMGREQLRVSASVMLVRGQTRMLRLSLHADCLDVPCPDGESCAGGSCAAEITTTEPWPGHLASLDAGRQEDGSPSDSGLVDAGVRDGGDTLDGSTDGGRQPRYQLQTTVYADDPMMVGVSRDEFDMFATADRGGPGSVHAGSYWMKLPADFVERAAAARQSWRLIWEMKLPDDNKWRCHVLIVMRSGRPVWEFKGHVELTYSPTGSEYDEFKTMNDAVAVPLGRFFRVWYAVRFSGSANDGYFKFALGPNAETVIFDYSGRIGHPDLPTSDGNYMHVLTPFANFTGWTLDGIESTTFYGGPFQLYDALPSELGGSATPVWTTRFAPDTALDRTLAPTGPVFIGIDRVTGDDWMDLRDGTVGYEASRFQYVSGPPDAWDYYVRTEIVPIGGI